MDLFAKNIKFLRKKKGLSQEEISTSIGFKQTAWSGYERGSSKPNFSDLKKIIKFFAITATELIETDLENVALNENSEDLKKAKNVALNVAPTVALKGVNKHFDQELKITIVGEPEPEYGKQHTLIPITDISVAAGGGQYNQEYIENVESLRLPEQFIKRNATYLCFKIKGISMAPTLQDGGYVVCRLMDKGEWAKMPDECIFVVSDNEGKSYLKRVKNRFKKGFIVLRSDSPDRADYPSFNLAPDEINTIWYVEWYFTAKMPDINSQYYQKLQQLEERVDAIENKKH